ncbi:MAG: SoxR reducing system RseC family protein [Spirochaetia bacterium]|jgi:positive regulator of sigma E activity|nr:SoxR reducing system RseC family protein [Spirochaetia bacterium]
MVEQGKITGINGEEIILSCSSLSGGCKSCSGNSFCSTNGKIFSALNENNFDLKSGDTVEIFLPPGQTIFAGFMVLIFPLLSFILFFLAGSWIFSGSEGLGILSGIAGLAVGFYITFYYNKISKRKNTPQITKRISNGQ